MIAFLIRVLEFIFAVGLLGSGVVLLLTLVEDAKMLFEKDKGVHQVIGETHSVPTTTTVAVR